MTARRYGPTGLTDVERFWSKVEKTETCWLWRGHIGPYGYGAFAVRSHGVGQWTTLRAHRYAYELVVGAIPDGLVLDHLCRVRHCVNPLHLEPVTQRENLRRSPVHEPKSHCRRGHPFDAENTEYAGKQRVCRACRLLRLAARQNGFDIDAAMSDAGEQSRWHGG